MEAKDTELPLSLIECNILPRVPAKSIGPCMCVCKQWKSFISSSTFVRVHLNHVTINEYKLLILDQLSATFRTPDGYCNTNTDPIVGFIFASLDGLVCLGASIQKLAFWNPLTGAYKKLSCNPYLKFDTKVLAIGFYNDPSNDYKILVLTREPAAYIYSRRLDSWRQIEISIQAHSRSMWSPATFWGDCLYFIVTGTQKIICFDVKAETFREIQFPPIPRYATKYCATLAVFNRCIHLCLSYGLLLYGNCNMWRMDGDEGWVKVDASNFKRQHVCTSTGNVLEENKYNFLENMETEDFIRHWCFYCSPDMKYKHSRIMYVETLVSPNP